MNKTLTPHTITTSFVSAASSETCTDYTLYIYAWKGSKASVPAATTYEITKDNPTASTGNDVINISRLINDLIDFTPIKDTATSLNDANNQIWVKTEVTYTSAEPTDATTPQYAATNLFSQGYGYGMDGANPTTPTNKLLFSGTEFKVARTSIFNLALDLEDWDYTVDGAITLISYPGSEINESFNETSTDDTTDTARYLIVDVSETTNDTYIELSFNSQTVTLLITEECRYTPVDIHFINKEGHQATITFFKEQTESLKVTSDDFESDRGQPNLGNHQYVTFNVQGKTEFSANTGFVSEDLNDAFKQLMLSHRVWKIESNVFIPLKVGKKSLEYKTRQKDRLINYEFTFEYAFNEINNI